MDEKKNNKQDPETERTTQSYGETEFLGKEFLLICIAEPVGRNQLCVPEPFSPHI